MTESLRIYEISIVAGTLFIVLLAIVVPFGRYLILNMNEKLATIAEVQRDIRQAQRRAGEELAQCRANTDALRNAITIAYTARSNGDDDKAIKSQYRLAAKLLKRIEED